MFTIAVANIAKYPATAFFNISRPFLYLVKNKLVFLWNNFYRCIKWQDRKEVSY